MIQTRAKSLGRENHDMKEADHKELKHYLELQKEAARLWRYTAEIAFRSFRIESRNGELLTEYTAVFDACEKALVQGRRIEKLFGYGHWPVEPDPDGRGAVLNNAVKELWGRWLDRMRTATGSRGVGCKTREHKRD
jgi:hypothetical protein